MSIACQIVRRPLRDDMRFSSDMPPLLQRVYAARNIVDAHELDYSLEQLCRERFSQGDRATQLLVEAVTVGQSILIIGDYDADGATSTALTVRALRLMGAQRVGYLVPNRFEYGYGLSPEIVAVASTRAPDLIITVDNGISSVEGVAAARAAGIRVLITDHHLPGAELPAADAILNPNMPGEIFPGKHLAGVGVVFYAMLALRSALREQRWFERSAIAEPNLAQLLDLVALGTVADVVSLDYNNRILVEQGLRRIRVGQCVAGITALLQQGKRSPEAITAADLGFVLAPRLNAAGRLDDMSLGIECLLTDDLPTAQRLAAILSEMNDERRRIERDMQTQAVSELERVFATLTDKRLPAGLCLYDVRWHQGVIGIVASRIKDRVHRPVIAFAPAGGDEIKGSARSVPNFHIRDALDSVAARYPGLIQKFGGHAMAAGLSLSLAQLEPFRQAFAEEAARQLGASAGQAELHSDGELRGEEFTLATAEALRQAGPWGQGFPEPLFDNVFCLLDFRIVSDAHIKLTLCLPDRPLQKLDAIAFNDVGEKLGVNCRYLHVAYQLDVNEFNGLRKPQLRVRYYEPVSASVLQDAGSKYSGGSSSNQGMDIV